MNKTGIGLGKGEGEGAWGWEAGQARGVNSAAHAGLGEAGAWRRVVGSGPALPCRGSCQLWGAA